MQLIDNAISYSDNTAIITNDHAYIYNNLLAASTKVAATLLENQKDLKQARVAFIVPPSFEYVAVQWGIWRVGAIAVPLCLSHPKAELEYVVENSGCSTIITDSAYRNKLLDVAAKLNAKLLSITQIFNGDAKERSMPLVNPDRTAMILYTSGTTSKPKGVVITHKNIEAQTQSMIQAWGWSEKDKILSVLPLHHTHGIINVVTTALRSGACVEFLPKFDAKNVWEKFIHADLTLFMAVPTIYYKLISFWEQADRADEQKMSEACKKFRLMVSGSAALPVTVLKKWKTISGHTLLERYGMTEIGMALSNPLNGERRPGHVGLPMPGVSVKLVDENWEQVNDGEQGEILVQGPNIFKEYWNEPAITQQAFADGWFKTGDMAVVDDRYYKIIGRASVDIIKSGGYKISALEIEEVLRQHPAIDECAVVGIENKEWGEVVAAALMMENDFDTNTLNAWLGNKLAPYKIPKRYKLVKELPRNALGKVVKPKVKKLFYRSI